MSYAALRSGSEAEIENATLILFRDTDAVVGHAQPRAQSRIERNTYRDRTPCRSRRPFSDGANRIVEKIPDDFADFVGEPADRFTVDRSLALLFYLSQLVVKSQVDITIERPFHLVSLNQFVPDRRQIDVVELEFLARGIKLLIELAQQFCGVGLVDDHTFDECIDVHRLVRFGNWGQVSFCKMFTECHQTEARVTDCTAEAK